MSSRYDLVIFTARQEEEFFLWDRFDPKPDDVYPVIKRATRRNNRLHIGLVNFNAMGSMTSSILVCEVMERVLPRAALLTGLAAAWKPTEGRAPLERGDVGVSNTIFYHSYGKIKGNKTLPDIRLLNPVTWPRGVDNNWIDRRIREGQWREQVNRWWDAGDQARWLDGITNRTDREKYKDQVRHTDLAAMQCNMASGELVVASQEYVSHIRNEFKSSNIIMFDMEAYSVAQACGHYDVPCFVIKGISDFADSPEAGIDERAQGQGKDDRHRFAAIAGASAFVFDLIEHEFGKEVVAKSSPSRPNIKRVRDCYLPEAKVICPHVDGENRRCVEVDRTIVAEEAVAWLARTFDDVDPERYSRHLRESIPSLADNGVHITSFFPYSADNMLRLLLAELDRREAASDAVKAGKQLLDLHLKTISDIRALANVRTEMAKCLAEFARATRLHFQHFLAWNGASKAALSAHPEAEKPRIARIVLFENESMADSLLLDPLNFIYPAVLGEEVPTFYSSYSQLKHMGCLAADVIFIDRRTGNQKAQPRVGDLTAIRFYIDSKTLIVTGIPCEGANAYLVRNRGKEQDRQRSQALFRLYETWEEEHGSKSLFKAFPLRELGEQYRQSLTGS